jgi:hypothetical protein
MTKVEISYKLTRPLDDTLMKRVADAHGIYGLLRVQVLPRLDGLRVEYDASRLTADEIEAALLRAGIPLERHSG